VVMTGDLHGHRRNFEKLVRYCRLENTPIRHIILHEMIHEEPQFLGDADRSVELLLDAAKWKTFFPEQVHFLQSNHELAQLQNHQISKGGRIVTDDFDRGVREVFETENVSRLLDAIDEFIASFPLAGRTSNRIFLAHSLPDVQDIEDFDPRCVDQPPHHLDLSEGGPVYQMTWGRRHTPAMLERLASAYDVDYFILGHQPQEWGHQVLMDRVIILASDHNHGVFLPIDCQKTYNIETLAHRVRPLAGVE